MQQQLTPSALGAPSQFTAWYPPAAPSSVPTPSSGVNARCGLE